ncbi:MAG: hypothetical protein FWD17_07425 [Polyangiaceae bacterium]|nr:hypothetical protein [Polyangiaceae bacterium]
MLALANRNALVQGMLAFREPYTVLEPRATVDGDLASLVRARAGTSRTATVEDAIHDALDLTSKALFFGLGHRTHLDFGGRAREGNCIEYAHLFAHIFNALRNDLGARAYVVHSADARALGLSLPWPALREHDFAMVTSDMPRATQIFVDPALYDAGLGWNISRAVTGKVPRAATLR